MSAPADPVVQVRAVSADALLDVRHAVLRKGLPRDTARFPGDDDPLSVHLLAEVEREGVGCVTLLPVPYPEDLDADAIPAWQLRGMAVLDTRQGSGVGARLLDAARKATGGAPMWCNARASAIGFYERQGWRVVSDVFDVPGIGPHRRMVHGA